MCLGHVLKADNVGVKRMSSGRLFQATGQATQMPGCRVVALSPQSAKRVGTVETGMHN